mmetsp:Transcript_9574/g.40621  ORF Transcript_9574/g.40621 Transcript_9574/m.40621 type:complete len:262 (+) Transcript_9574:1624-2409(+)
MAARLCTCRAATRSTHARASDTPARRTGKGCASVLNTKHSSGVTVGSSVKSRNRYLSVSESQKLSILSTRFSSRRIRARCSEERLREFASSFEEASLWTSRFNESERTDEELFSSGSTTLSTPAYPPVSTRACLSQARHIAHPASRHSSERVTRHSTNRDSTVSGRSRLCASFFFTSKSPNACTRSSPAPPALSPDAGKCAISGARPAGVRVYMETHVRASSTATSRCPASRANPSRSSASPANRSRAASPAPQRLPRPSE